MLGDVCELNPTRPAGFSRREETQTSFVPMAAVDDLTGTVARPEVRPYSAVKKGYTYFAEGDVLFAKITPCMQNGKHAVARGLTDGVGFGTTEFHVLRPGHEITAEWIHSFIRQPWVLHEATRHFTGAVGQQRVPEGFLSELEIPLPPLPEQRRIAGILNEQMQEVEKARKATQAQLEAARALPAAYLREVFESEEAKKWSRKRLGDVLNLRNEVVHPYENPKGPATFVGLEHIEAHTGKRVGSVPVEMSELTGRKPRFYSGDIVYGYLRPYLNKVWIAEFDGLCSVDQYVYATDDTTAVTEFVAAYMRSSTYLARAPITETPGQLPRIRKEEVARTEIGLPTVSVQKRIVAEMLTAGHQHAALGESSSTLLDAVDKLPAALLRKAFGGEL